MKRTDTIKVARVIARLNVGGPAQHILAITEAERGVETRLLTGVVPEGEKDMTPVVLRRGVEPIVIREMRREISGRDVLTVVRLFLFFRRFQPDIIETHTSKAGATGRIAGWLYRWLTPSALLGRPRQVRLVHTFHGHVFHGYFGRRTARLFVLVEKVLARMTDAIIVLSEQQRREISETYGVGRSEQFHVVPLALDLADLEEADQPSGDELVVGIVGRLAPIKNHELFLRVATRFGPEDHVRFVIYGDGSDRPHLEKRARELGLSGSLTFAGTCPPREIYRSINIAALTSSNEGTPLTLIEAMAASVPVVSTNVGGVGDLLGTVEETVRMNEAVYEIRQRGITTAPDDEAAFAAALRRLLQDAGLREKVAAAGRTFARATFAKERVAAHIIAIYRELLE